MTDFYGEALNEEAFGHVTGILKRGASPGNGMKIIDRLVAELPPFPFSDKEEDK